MGKSYPTWKKRTSQYSGNSNSYDFDEHFKAHYQRPFKPASARHFASRKITEQELNDYWNTKEFSSSDNQLIREIRDRILYRFMYVIIGFFLLSMYGHFTMVNESEIALKKHQDRSGGK